METLRRPCAPLPCPRDGRSEAWAFERALEASRRRLEVCVEADLRERFRGARSRTLAAVRERSED